MPPLPRWTHETPTANGFYWLKSPSHKAPEVVYVFNGVLFLFQDPDSGENMSIPGFRYKNALWAGPIPEPGEEKE